MRLIVLLSALLLIGAVQAADTPGGETPAECGPGPGGETCTSTDSAPASQGNSSDTNQGAGNPINVITGNKYQREVDMPALPGVLGLELIRHYNSSHADPVSPSGITGRGWRLSYETDLYPIGNTLQIVQADGTRIIFVRNRNNPSQCATHDPSRGNISIQNTARGEEYLWTWSNGRTLRFDTRGKLVQIKAPSGEFVSLARDPAGALMKVTDPQGRSLVLGYPDQDRARPRTRFNGVTHIDSPVGRFSYEYGSASAKGYTGNPRDLLANLVLVRSPDAVSRRYLYEDPAHATLLTGISVELKDVQGKVSNRRINTWAYDSQGLGVLSVKGWPKRLGKDGRPVPGTGIEQVNLDYGTPGQTTLTNSLGQKTVYRHAIVGNEHRLLEVKGAGCASCGEANVRYSYDGLGRLIETTWITPGGRPIRTLRQTRDGYGRVIAKHEWVYVNGKPEAAILIARYEYAGQSTRPSQIARPSVIAGREAVTRTSYNALGQPLAVTETGYSPSPGAVGEGRAAAITRTTTYAYAQINGRSVLTRIDGPLTNGPKGDSIDSDITQYHWDERGNRLLAVIWPGNLRQSLRYDTLGRSIETAVNDGGRIDTRRIHYSAFTAALLQVEAVERIGTQVRDGQPMAEGRLALTTMRAHFDALGRRIEAVDAAGRAIHFEHDLAGRLIALADGSGHQNRLDLDSEGHIERAVLYRPGPDATPWRATYYWHDDYGRRTGRLLSDGQLDTWAYGDDGQLAEHIDGDEIRTRYLRNARQSARQSARVMQSPDGWNRLTSQSLSDGTLIDDFDRVLRQTLPDHGSKTARYDAAGRIIEIVNADGSRIGYTYDVFGRLTSKTIFDAQGKTLDSVRLAYQGRLLAERRDGAQTSHYRYDALGRMIGETIQLAGLDQPLLTATRYDPDTGLVVARKLIDGRLMRIERGDPATGAAARSLTLQAGWVAAIQDWAGEHLSESVGAVLGRWLPSEPVVAAIVIDPFDGLASYTAGNGIETKRSYDIAGRLTKLDIQKVGQYNYRYGNGPRVRSIDGPNSHADYHYAGFGRLVQSAEAGPKLVKAEYNVPVRDALGRTLADRDFRYTYTAQGQIDTVSDPAGRPLARYRYNSLGQRVAKTVMANSKETTTWTLWQDGNRVAELDEKGNIAAQYLYLTEGQRVTPIAKLDSEHIHFIHTDHRGAPVAMSDEQQAIVWRANVSAWGSAQPVNAETYGPASLNFRLPGQYYDEETGLHDNWHRTYDPDTGRYLQPDPLGYPDGPDAYLYASGDPINRIDANGLYAIDVHYYMTYFLALVSGLSEEQAWIIATAAQTIDDVNPYTDAMPHMTPWDADSGKARELYHFTQTSTDWNTYSTQITNLHDYAMQAEENYGSCLKLQFYGEYLHAFQDTYGHRDNHDVPYGAAAGHMLAGTHPDKTYNHSTGDWYWLTNEDRTLKMENAVFSQLQSDWGTSAKDKDGNAITAESLNDFFVTWNKEQSDDEKTTMLNEKLQALGLPTIEPYLTSGSEGLACRLKYLQDAKLIDSSGKATETGKNEYANAILDTVTTGAGTCKY
jgi:RHS repeat-associated protein